MDDLSRPRRAAGAGGGRSMSMGNMGGVGVLGTGGGGVGLGGVMGATRVSSDFPLFIDPLRVADLLRPSFTFFLSQSEPPSTTSTQTNNLFPPRCIKVPGLPLLHLDNLSSKPRISNNRRLRLLPEPSSRRRTRTRTSSSISNDTEGVVGTLREILW